MASNQHYTSTEVNAWQCYDLVFHDIPCVTGQIPRGEFMIIEVGDHLGRPWPGGVSFDENQLVTGLPCGVTAAAGTHPSSMNGVFAG